MAFILIVDDEPYIVTFLEFLLRQAGHEVAAVSDGLQALESAGARPPDLILSDVNMPNLDGHALSKRLAADAQLRRVPLIILTTRGQLAPLFQLAPNVVDFLEKPFAPKALDEAVASALSTTIC